MNRLLIVEDEPSIRESLYDYFTLQEFAVVGCSTAEEAEVHLKQGPFSLILLDLRLPEKDGLDLLDQLRRGGDLTPVIITTARGEEAQRVRGLDLGADDYVLKPFSLHELVARVRAILRRTGSHVTRVTIGQAIVDFDALTIERDSESHRMLKKEADLLAYLYRNGGRTFSRQDLLREVWGFRSSPTTRTVDTHVFTLRKKLERDPAAPRHLLTVRGAGYRLDLNDR